MKVEVTPFLTACVALFLGVFGAFLLVIGGPIYLEDREGAVLLLVVAGGLCLVFGAGLARSVVKDRREGRNWFDPIMVPTEEWAEVFEAPLLVLARDRRSGEWRDALLFQREKMRRKSIDFIWFRGAKKPRWVRREDVRPHPDETTEPRSMLHPRSPLDP